MYAERDLLPISAINQLLYCPRRCALIHTEQQWAENRFTVQGQQLHAKAHDGTQSESRPGVRIVRAMPVRSLGLGLFGVCDVVEFPADPTLPALPIEYKRGKPKRQGQDGDRVQVAAQAICLEEMLTASRVARAAIPLARIFYGRIRRRVDVAIDDTMRQRVRQVALQLHELFDSQQTPSAIYDSKRCDPCSLRTLCQPEVLRPHRATSQRFRSVLNVCLKEGESFPESSS